LIRLICSLLLLAGCCGELVAHEMKTALTKVVFNNRSGNIEVMHRFYVHDAEHGVKQLFDKGADLLNSELTQLQFNQYVSEQFTMTSLTAEVIKLTLLGGQLDGRFFWVYQEVPIPATVAGLRFQHRALQELWPAQVNTVNIEGKGEIKSLIFDYKTDWQQVSF
jgi:hypothetical protein